MAFFERKVIPGKVLGSGLSRRTIPENWWYTGNFELLQNRKIVFCWMRPSYTAEAELIGKCVINALTLNGGVLLVCNDSKLSRVLIENAGIKGVPFILLEPLMAAICSDKLTYYHALIRKYNGLIINATGCATHPTNVLPWTYYVFAAYLAKAIVIVGLAAMSAHRQKALFANDLERAIWLPALPARTSKKVLQRYLRSLRHYRDLNYVRLIGLDNLKLEVAKL